MALKRKWGSSTQPRRVSREIDLPKKAPQKDGAVYLPAELKIMIMDYLECGELKALRLVSWDWSTLVTPMLFWQVYISPRKLDLEVFNNITQHPVLSTYIEEVVYDASHFEINISRRAYFDRLCDNITKIFIRKGQDLEWPSGHLVTSLKSGQTHNELYNKHKYDHFVEEGYRDWQRHSWYEGWTTSHRVLSETLCEGVKRTSNMNSFIVTGRLWRKHLRETSSLDPAYSGCPSTRRWKALYARPTLPSDNEQIELAFRTAACALQLTQNLRSLDLFNSMYDIEPYPGLLTLDRPLMTDSVLNSAIQACARLVTFCFTVGSSLHYNNGEALSNLPRMLSHMPCLRNLTLDLSFQSCGQIFPQACEWPQLTCLDITFLEVGGYELVSLMVKKLPKLQWLDLFGIHLSNGSWEGVVEGMRRLTSLRHVSLGDPKYHKSNALVSNQPDSDWRCPQFLKEIEDYVVWGGRHPCLSPEAAPEESLDFWRRMCPSQGNGRRITLLDNKIELRTWDY